jgi:hypothetical protein
MSLLIRRHDAKLKEQLNEILEHCFIVIGPNSGYINFKKKIVAKDDFVLFCDVLDENEILGVARVLADVYKDFKNLREQKSWDSKPRLHELNGRTDAGGELVRTILDLKSSSIHKLLLLTSGNNFLKSNNLESMQTLASSKSELISDVDFLKDNHNFYERMKKCYILPSVSLGSRLSAIDQDPFMRFSTEASALLLAFLGNNDADTTLEEFFKLEFAESIKTDVMECDLTCLTELQLILLSKRYHDFAYSMTALELRSLCLILSKGALDAGYPEDIIRNRSKQMIKGTARSKTRSAQSILDFMSEDEATIFSSREVCKKIDSVLFRRGPQYAFPMIVFATIAEVASVKGEDVAVDVALAIKNIPYAKQTNNRFFENLVLLITESLKPENENVPFAWLAQLSEHSWVLESASPLESSNSLVV